MKALGQAGLDFIAGKYKELKTALSYKVDNSQITDVYDAGDEELIPSLKALSELGKSLRRDLDRKVYKVSGKGLSANDYTDSDKAKVDAIPANPKYTDTTYDLSKYAEKSNISRCKTKGYNTSNTWQSLSTERDLEDWIGDFDKRTRELKNNKGLTGDGSEIKQQIIKDPQYPNDGYVHVAKWGRIVHLRGYFDTERIRHGFVVEVPLEFASIDRIQMPCRNGDVNLNVYREDNGDIKKFEVAAFSSHDSGNGYDNRYVDWSVMYFAKSL